MDNKLANNLEDFIKTLTTYKNAKRIASEYKLTSSNNMDEIRRVAMNYLWNELIVELGNNPQATTELKTKVIKELREYKEFLSSYEIARNELLILEVTEGYSYNKMIDTNNKKWKKAYEEFELSKKRKY